jgi:nitrile hydratase accessory protein
MDGIADMGGVVGRSATYALAREEPVLAERRRGLALALALVCNRLTACSLHAFRRAVERSKLTDCLGTGYLGRGLNGAEVEGKFAPPLSGDELVFAEPWESRAFAMAVILFEAGVVTRLDFQPALVARITRWEAQRIYDAQSTYYQHWLGGLEDRLADCGSIVADAATVHAQELSDRPTDNDHEH